jgi:uncharacterized membrane protein
MLIVGVALRLMQAYGQSLWYDELYAVRVSRLPLGELLGEAPATGHPPLFHLLGKAFFSHGASDFQTRLISLVAGVFTIWLAYLLGKELFSRRVGLLAAALATVSPSLVLISAETTNYALLVALSLATLLLLLRAIRQEGWRNWAAFTAVATALLYTHGLGLVLLVAAVPFYLILDYGPRRQLKPWLISQAVLAFTFIPWYLMMRVGPGPVRLASPGELLHGIGKAPMMIIKGEARLPLIGSSWLVFLALAVIVAAIMLLSPRVRRAFHNRESLGLMVVLVVIVVIAVALALAVDSIVADQLSIRYYAVAIVPLLLLLALAIASAPRQLGVVVGGLLMAGMLFQTTSLIASENWDYHGLMQHLSDNYQQGDVMLCFPVHHCIVAAEYYVDEQLSVTGGWVAADGDVLLNAEPGKVWQNYRDRGDDEDIALTGAELESRIDIELAGAERVWLVLGDDDDNTYPGSSAVIEALGEGWRETGSWEFNTPFNLKLFERSES